MGAAVMHPRSQKALLDGLQAPDPKERRQWWHIALEFGIGRPAEGEDGGTTVLFQNLVPAPPREDYGAAQRQVAPARPLPARVVASDRAAMSGYSNFRPHPDAYWDVRRKGARIRPGASREPL